MFYAHMLLAEAFGTTGTAQVVDLFLNNNDQYTCGYAIYENGNPARVVLINYLTDASGAHNYTANVAIGGGTTGQAAATPSTVQVKYLLAPSATEKWNITWGQQVRDFQSWVVCSGMFIDFLDFRRSFLLRWTAAR